MCKNPTCGTWYPTCKVVHTEKVHNLGNDCVLDVTEFLSDYAGREFILEVDQPILNTTKPCMLDYGFSKEPIVDRFGNTVHADQLIKEIARREREADSTCPCEVAQFRVRICYDPRRFAIICDLPCSNYCAGNFSPQEDVNKTAKVAKGVI